MIPTMSLPLSGVRVLDLSRVLAGPLCGMVLGDFGAEVIKVEHPERGDDTRDWGMRVGSTQTTYFNSVNRNKQSVTVDLQSSQGRDLLLKLAAQSDVVIQNFKFGGAEKLGVRAAERRPRDCRGCAWSSAAAAALQVSCGDGRRRCLQAQNRQIGGILHFKLPASSPFASGSAPDTRASTPR